MRSRALRRSSSELREHYVYKKWLDFACKMSFMFDFGRLRLHSETLAFWIAVCSLYQYVCCDVSCFSSRFGKEILITFAVLLNVEPSKTSAGRKRRKKNIQQRWSNEKRMEEEKNLFALRNSLVPQFSDDLFHSIRCMYSVKIHKANFRVRVFAFIFPTKIYQRFWFHSFFSLSLPPNHLIICVYTQCGKKCGNAKFKIKLTR